MKPTKNRSFCISCRKYKMLFESQNKADNFIKFNAKEILDTNSKAPVRSYYCQTCGGWHVTSNPSLEEGEKLDHRDALLLKAVDFQAQQKQNIKTEYLEFTQKLDRMKADCNQAMILADFSAAYDITDLCELETNDFIYLRKDPTRLGRIRLRISKIRSEIAHHERLYNLSEEAVNALLETQEPRQKERDDIEILKKYNSLKKVYSVFDQQNKIINCNDEKLVTDIVESCKRHIQIACTLSKPARKILENKLNELALKCVVLKSNSQECNAEKKQTKDSKPKEIKNKQEVKEEVEHIPLSAEYRATVLSLIAKIQDIEQYYKEADYESCYDILDICSFILDDLKNEDVNRKIIQEQLDLWQERLKNLNA